MRHQFLRGIYGADGSIEGYQFRVTTPANLTTFNLRTNGTVLYDVNWGDGNTETGITLNVKPHEYATAGTYTVKVTTTQPFRFYANNASPDDTRITAVLGAEDGFPWSTDFSDTWFGCSSLTSFPLLNLSSGTNFNGSWNGCSSLTSFPALDLSSGTSFSFTWGNCFDLTSFPLLNLSSGTNFNYAWFSCTSLTSFPALDLSSGTIFSNTWRNCSSLTSFPAADLSSGTNFGDTWRNCSSLTSFPALDLSSGTNFKGSWNGCTSLVNFPAGIFNLCTTTTSYDNAFSGCALNAQSIENILVSIDTAGASNGTLTLSGGTNANTSTWTTAANAAYVSLVGKGWTITQNGTAPS